MTNLGPNALFILYAYVVAFGVLSAMIFWVAIDHRVQWQKLKELEAGGVTRRSSRATEKTA